MACGVGAAGFCQPRQVQRQAGPAGRAWRYAFSAWAACVAWRQGLGAAPVQRAYTPGRHALFFAAHGGSQCIDAALWAYAFRSALQPGARVVPLHFLSGGLFSRDIHTVYESVSQPMWMSHGVRDDFKDIRGKALLHDRGNWHTTVFQTAALP